MRLEDAIKQAIRAYYEGSEATELELASDEESMYNKEYFDDFEKELLGEEDAEAKLDTILAKE